MIDILLGLINFAAILGSPEAVGVPNQNVNAGSFTRALNVVYMVAGVIAVVSVIIAGILFTTSSGDPQKAARARNAILYSVIGIVVVAFAFAVTNFVIGRVK